MYKRQPEIIDYDTNKYVSKAKSALVAVGVLPNPAKQYLVKRVVGVERTFPVHTPVIEKIELVKKGEVRRAKLYYLRDLRGKAAKIREKRDGIEGYGDGILSTPEPVVIPEPVVEAVVEAPAVEAVVDVAVEEVLVEATTTEVVSETEVVVEAVAEEATEDAPKSE